MVPPAQVIGVGATYPNMSRLEYSSANSDVELAAPGYYALSTLSRHDLVARLDDGVRLVAEPAPQVDLAWPRPYRAQGSPSGTVTSQLVDCGLGDATCKGAKGKVCLMQRGVNFFCEKAAIGVRCGCAALVFFNRDDQPPCVTVTPGLYASAGSTCSNSTQMVPAVGINLQQGRALQLLLQQGKTVMATVSTPTPQEFAPQVRLLAAAGCLWLLLRINGAVPGLDLPAGGLRAHGSRQGGRPPCMWRAPLTAHPRALCQTSTCCSAAPQSEPYGYYLGSGASAALATGVAGIVWAASPGCPNAEIRAALAATALDLGAAGRDDEYGNGLVQAQAALAYLAEKGCRGGQPAGPKAGCPPPSASKGSPQGAKAARPPPAKATPQGSKAARPPPVKGSQPSPKPAPLPAGKPTSATRMPPPLKKAPSGRH